MNECLSVEIFMWSKSKTICLLLIRYNYTIVCNIKNIVNIQNFLV